jgi:ubiquinone/menaquinone biosynthesis C-methylase UbiE
VRIARRTGVRLTGISVSRQQIARANARAAAAGLADRVEFRHANAMDLPFAEESFDAAIALESIIHMPDREKVLGQVAHALRPGGRLVLTDFFERGPIPEAKRPAVNRYLRDFLMTLADIDDYLAMIRQSGLRLVELLDITEQSCRQTFVQLSAQMTAERENLTGEFDEEMVDQFNPADMIDIPEFGSLLLVAERP